MNDSDNSITLSGQAEQDAGLHTPLGEERIRKRPEWLDSPELRLCLSHFKPPKGRLRGVARLRALEIISFAQGYDGKIVCCEYEKCPDPHTPFPIEQADVDHGHPDGKNDPEFLWAMHHICNSSEYQGRRKASLKSGSPAYLKKENVSGTATADEILQQQLLKQAPTTFQRSVKYKEQTLAYLVEYVKEKQDFEKVVADVESLTGCSHAKAVEYVNHFSASQFSPFKQHDNGAAIAPKDWVPPKVQTRQVIEARRAITKPICVLCSSPFDIEEPGCTSRTCATCMLKGEKNNGS